MKLKEIDIPRIKTLELGPNNNIESKIVYHYTSPEAFLNIIKENRVRFSDILYLNDVSEKKYVLKVLLEFCDENKSQFPSFSEAVNRLLAPNDKKSVINLTASTIVFAEDTYLPYKQDRSFVFCACKDNDSLNMWNYYVNNGKYQGYSIGINTGLFLKTFDNQPLLSNLL